MWRKHCIFPHKTLQITTNHFIQSLSFGSPTQLFFSSWNICSTIPLISITYLALIHNYNTIKYICFISSRQRADMLSRYFLNGIFPFHGTKHHGRIRGRPPFTSYRPSSSWCIRHCDFRVKSYLKLDLWVKGRKRKHQGVWYSHINLEDRSHWKRKYCERKVGQECMKVFHVWLSILFLLSSNYPRNIQVWRQQ